MVKNHFEGIFVDFLMAFNSMEGNKMSKFMMNFQRIGKGVVCLLLSFLSSTKINIKVSFLSSTKINIKVYKTRFMRRDGFFKLVEQGSCLVLCHVLHRLAGYQSQKLVVNTLLRQYFMLYEVWVCCNEYPVSLALVYSYDD